MKEQDLLNLGFKRKGAKKDYWFELNIGRNCFITNDNSYNNGKDEWHIGYTLKNVYMDTFWFNSGLIDKQQFLVIYHVLTTGKCKG